MHTKLNVVALLMVFNVFAGNTSEKDNLFVHAALGYGIGIGGYLTETALTLNGTTIIASKDIFLNYGAGLKFNAGVDYKLFDHFYAVAAIDYSNHLPSQLAENQAIIGNATVSTSHQYENWQLGIGVGILSSARVFDLLDVYISLSPTLFFTSATSTQNPRKNIIKYDTPASLGLISLCGVVYPLSDFASLVLELGAQTQRVNQNGYTEYESNGTEANAPMVFENNNVSMGSRPNIPANAFLIRIGARIGIF